MVNLYKLPDSLANPANAILSTMDGQRPLADVANTKAAAAAQSPMPPPPPTPGTSGKKRKRSEASLARDKLVSSKKYQTYKLYEELQLSEILNDPSEVDKLKEHIQQHGKLVISGYNEFRKTQLTEIRAIQESLAAREEEYKREIKRYQDKETERRLERAQILAKFEAAKRATADERALYMEEKVQLMEDREELEGKIQEQSQWKEKHDKLYAEVKELRKLKYAADRKAKGPVGVAR